MNRDQIIDAAMAGMPPLHPVRNPDGVNEAEDIARLIFADVIDATLGEVARLVDELTDGPHGRPEGWPQAMRYLLGRIDSCSIGRKMGTDDDSGEVA